MNIKETIIEGSEGGSKTLQELYNIVDAKKHTITPV